ncbi:MAG: hypothetical protein KatS3mg103_0114 [Phycisphaerales bacterium]|nr:MAG: hypothetical protein KatS3mg103_0114 [Phycisphaerales bacterium]
MQAVHRAVRKASVRLILGKLVRTLAVAVVAASVAVALLRVLLWLVGLPMDAASTALAALALAAGTAAVWTWMTRPDALAAARVLDHRAGLRERLSTALACQGQDDPWSAAVREDAQRVAAALDVAAAVPVRIGRRWPAAVFAVAACAAVWALLPAASPDVLGWLARERQRTEQQQQAEEAQQLVQAAEQIVQQVAEKTGTPLDAALTPSALDAANPQAMRLAALDALTRAQDALREKVERSDAALRMQAMQRELSRMRQPGQGPAAELARQLARGDFAAARQELETLAQKLANDELGASERAQLAEQLRNLQAQLEQIAQQQASLREALEQAGMDAQQARQLAERIAQAGGDSQAVEQALRQAMQQMPHLTAQQQQQLMQQAMQMAQACQACQSMGQQMGSMAQAAMDASQGQSMQGMQGMQAMQQMLGEMEMMQMELQSAEAMLAQTQAQMAAMGANPGKGMQGLQQGGKSGSGPMAGTGTNHATGEPTDPIQADTTPQRTPTRLGQGPIVAERLVYGELIRGESVAEFTSAVQAASVGVAQAIEENVVPVEWHESLQAYFGRLQKRAQIVQGKADEQASEQPKP